MRRRIKDQRGMALIIALIILLVLTLIGISAISTTTYEISLSGNERVGTNAFYAAEAGVEKGLNQIPDSTSIRSDSAWEKSYESHYWGGTSSDRGTPKGPQYLGQLTTVAGFEAGSTPTSYEGLKFSRYQVNGTGESFGATKEIEIQVQFVSP